MAFLKRTILLSGDVTIFILALWLSVFFRYQIINDIFYNYREHLLVFIPVFSIWLVVLYINQLYDFYQFSNLQFLTYATIRSSIFNFIISVIFFYCLPAFNITPKTILLILLVVTGLAIFAWRIVFNKLFISHHLLKKIVIIGNQKFEIQVAKMIKTNPSFGYHLLGLIVPDNSIRHKHIKTIGVISEIKKILPRKKMDVLAFDLNKISRIDTDLLAAISDYCLTTQTQVMDIYYLYEHLTGKIPLENTSQIVFTNINHSPQKINIYFKRIIDVLAGIVGLLIFILLFPMLFLLVEIDSPGPFFYSQTRLGINNRLFRVYKIRTMAQAAENKKARWANKNDKRITLVGKVLRRTCIDELPQFWNILIGEMSLVGPRPERPEFTGKLAKRQQYYYKRHLIKPGLTGWAQVNMGYAASYKDNDIKLEYDLYYLKNKSLFLDFIIILRTIRLFFINRGGV